MHRKRIKNTPAILKKNTAFKTVFYAVKNGIVAFENAQREVNAAAQRLAFAKKADPAEVAKSYEETQKVADALKKAKADIEKTIKAREKDLAAAQAVAEQQQQKLAAARKAYSTYLEVSKIPEKKFLRWAV